jgi:uncharacterized cupredoxin-like copper-binding protein
VKRLALLLLAAAAAGCGGGSGSSQQAASTGAQAAAPIRTITIDESEFKLVPSSISLTRPGTYVFRGVNKGTISHAIAVEGNGVDEDGPTVQPGGVSMLKVTLTKTGSYEIYCPVDGHKGQGMLGKVTVGAASGSGGTGGGTSTQKNGGSGY